MRLFRIAWSLIALSGIFVLDLDYARAQSVPRDFVAAAPAALFYTEDEMSENEKAALVKSRFKRIKTFDCSRWGVAAETDSSLVLKYCQDSSITVRSYRLPVGLDESIIVVQSSRSSGRANDISVFKFKRGQRAFEPLSSDKLAELGLEQITENDFLEPSQRFPPQEALPVGLELSEEGDLQGRPVTWMDPRWAHRREAFSVKFVWVDGRFKKVLEKAG